MKVAGWPPSATPRRAISARPRVTSAARCSQAESVADAGGDRHHVLDGAADLDADQVVVGVDAQMRAVQVEHQFARELRVVRGERDRRRQAACDFLRETRTGQRAARIATPHSCATI